MREEQEDHEEPEEHEEHIDERWLVSYSDMMTLLFGLFVMLYSMALEHQGGLDEQLQKMAKQTFASNTPTPSEPQQRDLPSQDDSELQRKLALITEERDRMREEIESLNRAQKNLEIEQAQTSQIMADRSLQLQKILALETNRTEQFQQIAELNKKLSELGHELEREKHFRVEQENRQKREIASIPSPQETSDEVSKATAKLKEMNQKLSQEKSKNKALDDRIQQLEQQISSLQNQNSEQKKDQKTFLMLVTKWTTEKHDVDMTVTDPSGRNFNYKSKKAPGRPGEFTLDSRSGPGAEIWQAENFIPGVYKVKLSLYQNYGNESPAEVSLTVVTSRKRVVLGSARLTSNGKREAFFSVRVAENGDL
jgi:DNA repair exonuclease SbcCD ATPase subunit